MLPSAPQALVRLYSWTDFLFKPSENPSRPGRLTRMFRGWESMQNLFSAETVRQANNCLNSSLFWSTVRASAVNMFIWNTTRPDLIAYHLAPYLIRPIYHTTTYLIMPICYTAAAGKLVKEAVACVEIKRGANKEEAERAAYQLLLQVAARAVVAYKKYRQPAQQAVEREASPAPQAASKLDWIKGLGKDLADGAVIRFNDPELQPMKQGMLAGVCTLPVLNLALGDTSSLALATITAAGVALRSTNLNIPN